MDIDPESNYNHFSNLPPEEGPYDEEEPLLNLEEEKRTARKYFVMGTVLIIVVFLLFFTTVAFAALYFNVLKFDNSRLPRWPKPSMSPLGKYSTAAVAADNEYCSEIGRNTLLAGGNAVDAAIAALFCIGVMDSHSSGIGGGHFMTIYNATTKQCHVIDARETAPGAATEEMFKGRFNDSRYGWKAVAVPGEIHGYWNAFTNYGSGRVSWKSLVNPTIQLVKEGYPTSSALAMALVEKEEWIKKEPTMKDFINPKTGKIFKTGEQIKTRTAFLETLRKIANASNPVEMFYQSDFTKKMVDEFKRNGGLLTMEDFKNYKSIIRKDDEVITTKLSNGRFICGPPPPSGSAVAQAILNIMDGFNSATTSFADISLLYHRFIESSKFAYAGRSYLGDMDFVENSTLIARNITSPEWAQWVRTQITDSTHPDSYYGGSFEAAPQDHGTTHISVMDRKGNVVSVTSTINLYFGAAISSESSGIVWNDEMDDFSSPGHANAFGYPPSPANFIRPGKRPMSSQSPLIIYDTEGTGQKVMAIGGAGGSTIISGVAGVALHTLWLEANVKEAIDAPRLHNQLQPNGTEYESNFPKAYIRALTARGHNLIPYGNITVVTAVERAEDGQIYANSDFRKGQESASAGY